jgi:hypothetical protein
MGYTIEPQLELLSALTSNWEVGDSMHNLKEGEVEPFVALHRPMSLSPGPKTSPEDGLIQVMLESQDAWSKKVEMAKRKDRWVCDNAPRRSITWFSDENRTS